MVSEARTEKQRLINNNATGPTRPTWICIRSARYEKPSIATVEYASPLAAFTRNSNLPLGLARAVLSCPAQSRR